MNTRSAGLSAAKIDYMSKDYYYYYEKYVEFERKYPGKSKMVMYRLGTNGLFFSS